MSGPARARRGSWVVLAALAVLLLLDLRVAARGPLDVPESSLSALVDALDKEKLPGDVLVHSPLFTVSQLSAFADRSIRPDLPAEEIRRSRRILVADVAAQPMSGLGRAAETIEFGPLRLFVYEPEGGARPQQFDFMTDYERVRMRVERPAGTVSAECNQRRGQGGFSCPGEAEWLYMAPNEHTIAGKPVRCMWAHPTTGGVVVYELPALVAPVPGKKLQLFVAGGINDAAVNSTKNGAVVINDIRQSGKKVGLVRVPNQLGWFEGRFDIAPDAPVEIRVTTPHDGMRHHCLLARIEEVDAP